MPTTFSKPSNYEQEMKWAKIWFNKLSAFHRVHSDKTENWNFSADQVIAIHPGAYRWSLPSPVLFGFWAF